MTTLGELAGVKVNPDGTWEPIQPRLLDDPEEDQNAVANASPAPSGGPTLAQVASGHATIADDGSFTFHDLPSPEAPDDSGGIWSAAYNTLLSTGMGLGSGVEVAGALTELAMPEIGDTIRKSGQSVQQYFVEKMDPEWQKAVNRSWLDLSSQGAYADWRSWVGGIASQVPYMLGTGGVGEIAALGIRGAATAAGKTAAATVGERVAKQQALAAASRKLGYTGAAAAAGAGEAAAGAAQATDEAGLPEEDRQAAMWAAAPIGATAGAIIGPKLEKLLHGGAAAGTGIIGRAGSIARRAGQGAFVEGVEEAGTQLGTEVGKATQGLDFDTGAILENAAGGAALGTATGPLVSAPGARRLRERANAARAGTAEAQAILNEANRLKDEEDAAGRVAVEQENARQAAAPLALPSPDTIPPLVQQPGVGYTRQEAPRSSPLNRVQPQIDPQIVTTTPVAESRMADMFLSAAGQEHLQRLEQSVNDVGAELDKLRTEINTTQAGPDRVRAVKAFQELRQSYKDATRARDNFLERQRKLLTPLQQQRLPGILEDGTPPDINHAAVAAMDEQELDAELDRWFGVNSVDPDQPELAGFPEPEVEPDQRPLNKLLAEKIKRSQAARKGHETRRAAAAASNVGPLQSPQQRVDTQAASALPTEGKSLGGAEMQAIRNRTPSNNDAPSVTPLQASALAAPVRSASPPLGPEPVAPSSPGAAAAELPGGPQPPAPLSPAASPAAIPGGPEGAPGAQVAPAQPTVQQQRGGVTLPPTDVPAPVALPPRDPTAVVGSEPPASMMGQVEQALTTKPRRKNLSKMTPRERLLKVLSAGPQTLDTTLAHMQDAFNNDKDPRAFKLIQRLRAAMPPANTKNPDQVMAGLAVEARPLNQGFQGLYDPRTNRIYIDPKQAEDPVTVFLHEAVHAATLYKLRTNTGFLRDVSRIMNDMRLMWARYVKTDVGDEAAFYDPEEFVARILTDFEFMDKLAILPAAKYMDDKSVWQRFRMRLATAFGVRNDPNTHELFNWMLEMVPDGTMLQDGNLQEVMTQLDNLGLGQPVASMLTTFRSMLRQTAANPGKVTATATGGSKRVWEWNLPMLGLNQISETYGDLGKFYVDVSGRQVPLAYDAINNYNKLNDIRDGYAEKLRSVADRIVSVGKQAAQDPLAKAADVDSVLMDARMWSLDFDKPMLDPQNAHGVSLPGGALLYNDGARRFAALRPMQRDFYRLVRDNSAAQRYDFINQIMIWRTRARAGKAAADQLASLIYHPSREVSNAHPTTGVGPSGVTIKYNRNLTMAEMQTFVTSLGLNPADQQRLAKDLKQVVDAIGREHGVYVPLRRNGNYYTMLRSPEITLAPMTKAQFDTLVSNNKRNEGDMEILDQGYNANTNRYTPKVRHIVVTAHDTEQQAFEELSTLKAEWSRRGLTIADERAARKQDNLFAALGLQSTSVDGLRRFLDEKLGAAMGANVGKAASDAALTYYLEKLPESSVRKSQLRARKIAGADRDVLHTYAQYANGGAYISAQLKYGAELADTLNRKMTEDIRTLQVSGRHEQANDLTIIQNFLKRRDVEYNRLSSKEATEVEGRLMTFWKRIPQLTGAWLLTGPGTILTNSLQVAQLGVPYFSARHGLGASMAALGKAYSDVTLPSLKEAGKEYVRFGKGALGATKVLAIGTGYTATVKDPQAALWQKATASLPVDERNHIEALALRKKIDFGLTADIKSLSHPKAGRSRWAAIEYMIDGAFILPQMAETVNRMVMGLASYRLNQQRVTTEVNNDRNIPAADKATVIQQRLLDASAEAIDRTQWNYSQANRPLYFQKEALRAALVFKTYPQNMWYTLVHNMVQSMHARTPQERKVALKFVAGMFATTAISAGMMGWLAFDPFYLAAVALTKGLTDEDDPEQALRNALNDFLGDWTDLVVRGAPYAAGVDTTNRLAFPTFFPIQDIVNARSKEGLAADWYKRAAVALGETILGAPGSIVGDTITPGAVALWNGDYATAREKLAPKSFGLADMVQAWNYANRGLADTKGDVYHSNKDLAYNDIIARALGFDSSNIAEVKAKRRAFFSADDRIANARRSLIADFAEAQMARDIDARTEALQSIKEWNTKYRQLGRGYVITRSTLKQSLRNRTEDDYLVANYGVRARSPGQRRLLQIIEERYQ